MSAVGPSPGRRPGLKVADKFPESRWYVGLYSSRSRLSSAGFQMQWQDRLKQVCQNLRSLSLNRYKKQFTLISAIADNSPLTVIQVSYISRIWHDVLL